MRTQEELLRLAIAALEDGRYLDGNFIQEHNLLADETIGLWSSLAQYTKGVLTLSKDAQYQIIFRGIADGMLPPDAIEYATARAQLPKATERALFALDQAAKKGGE
jgi:hypothetical protein